jgi:ATP-binding cassette subfamily F protein uup
VDAGCVLLVTHDRFFLDKVATGLIVFEGNGALRRHAGGYDLYRRLKEQRDAEAAARASERAPAKKAAPAPSKSSSGNGKARKLSWKEQKELEAMETAILEAEERKEELEKRLSDPAVYASAEESARVSAAYREAAGRVDALYARWAELEEMAAAATR